LWRLDQAKFGPDWDSGEGSWRVGGRWSSRGVRVVYAALDPATAILEAAVHKTFETLDAVGHVLTSAGISDAGAVRVVGPPDVPDPAWLRPGAPRPGQQAFGDALLRAHPFVLIPSVVSTHSWNLLFDPSVAEGLYLPLAQEPFSLDARLRPARGAGR